MANTRKTTLMFMVAALIGNRVIAAPTPGIAAHNALYRKPAPHDEPAFLQRLNGILGAGRGVPACRWQEW